MPSTEGAAVVLVKGNIILKRCSDILGISLFCYRPSISINNLLEADCPIQSEQQNKVPNTSKKCLRYTCCDLCIKPEEAQQFWKQIDTRNYVLLFGSVPTWVLVFVHISTVVKFTCDHRMRSH